MKLMKRISKIMMAATLAVAMMAAPMVAMAEGTGTASVSADKATVKAGDTVSFIVTVSSADAKVAGFNGTVNASDKLEFQGVSSSLDVTGNATGFTADSVGGGASETLTYTYKVAAGVAADEELPFSVTFDYVSDDTGYEITLAQPTVSASVKVAAGGQEPTNPDNPSDPSNPSNPSNPNGGSTTNKPANNKDLDDVPKTGDASSNMMVYMVVAIAAAGAIAVVSAKKLAR